MNQGCSTEPTATWSFALYGLDPMSLEAHVVADCSNQQNDEDT